MKKLIIMFGIVLSIVITVALMIIVNKPKSSEKENLEYITLESRSKVYINGKTIPKENFKIYIDSNYSNIVETYVEDGEKVEKGEVLYRGKNDAISEQIKQSNNQIKTYERQIDQISRDIKKINDKKNNINNEINIIKKAKSDIQNKLEEANEPELVNIKSEISTIEAKIEGYNAQIESCNEQLNSYDSQLISTNESVSDTKGQINTLKQTEYKDFISQISGTVKVIGEKSNYTSPYIEVSSTELIIEGIVDEKNHYKIKEYQDANILVISTNEKVEGKIKYINSEAEESSVGSNGSSSLSQYKVLLEVNNQEKLISGYHVQAIIFLEDYAAIIPKGALISFEGKNYVYKEINSQLVKCEIEYREIENSNKIEVTKGIHENEKILVNPKSNTEIGLDE